MENTTKGLAWSLQLFKETTERGWTYLGLIVVLGCNASLGSGKLQIVVSDL